MRGVQHGTDIADRGGEAGAARIAHSCDQVYSVVGFFYGRYLSVPHVPVESGH